MNDSYKVLSTTDYKMFRRLDGNRSVTELRVKKILKSISKVGYIPNPILTNERYEVVDGQARLDALERLNLPVYYYVVPGIGREECVAMNINQTNWTMLDFIQSYAEIGNESYRYLLELMTAYGHTFKPKVIMNAISGKTDFGSKIIKEGRFTCTEDDYKRADIILTRLMQYAPIFSKVKGHNEFYYMAVEYCFIDEQVDKERLYQKLYLMQANLIPVANIHQALEQIEDIYNHKIRTKVYIKTNYRKHLDSKYGWYAQKYGDKYTEED